MSDLSRRNSVYKNIQLPHWHLYSLYACSFL